MSHRAYPLADILSVTTGRLLSHRRMDGLYDLLGYMTGQSLFTHQLPRAADACGPALLAQHPQLADVAPPQDLDAPDLMAWLANAEQEHGRELPVEPLPADAWEQRDPIGELSDMVRPEKVIVISTVDDEQ
ncbi:DUF7736 domain-containing protein [Streptomyces mexicanus]|uniref:DUF7736 domain-containing protein n=1 Tax=Streptomyces mexicanus TaxID=178566 RepID=UPI003649B041